MFKNNISKKCYRIGLISIVLCVALDQVSKNYAIEFLLHQPGMIYHLTSWCSGVYSWNYGISFGMFTEYAGYSNSIFLAINCTIVSYFVYLMLFAKSTLQFYGLSVIIGGAIGNLVDRFTKGAVFDFIYLHYSGNSFPAFNVADSLINIGATILIVDFLISHRNK